MSVDPQPTVDGAKRGHRAKQAARLADDIAVDCRADHVPVRRRPEDVEVACRADHDPHRQDPAR